MKANTSFHSSDDHYVFQSVSLVHQVEAAIYVTDTILLKYFNLFDTDSSRSHPLHQVPLIPPTAPSSTVNKSVGSLPQEDKELELKQSILNFHSIAFTRTMVKRLFRRAVPLLRAFEF